MPNLRRRHRNDLGSIFAASVITVLGTGTSCAIYAVGSSNDSWLLQALIIAPALLFLSALIGVCWPKLGSGLEFWGAVFRSRADPDHGIDYQPRRRDPEPVHASGQQKPITANEVREIRLLNNNTWVPSRTRKTSEDDFLE